MTLTEFLHARIAEDEAVARDAIAHGEGCLDWADGGDPTDRHIARWDPSRVLAECEAKRRIVAVVTGWRHDDQSENDCWYSCPMAVTPDGESACCDDAAVAAGQCTCGLEARQLAILVPLALPYADHPDYRPEWRS